MTRQFLQGAADGVAVEVVLEGLPSEEVSKIWSDLCQPKDKVAPEFKVVYPSMTTMQGNRFRFRGGDQERRHP